MNAPSSADTFRGIDGYAGFRGGQAYRPMPDVWDSGTVTAKFDG